MSSVLGRNWFGWRGRAPLTRHSARLTAPVDRPSTGLRFSDGLFVSVFGLAVLLAISTPVFGFPAHLTALNHFTLILLAPVIVLHLLGMLLNHVAVPWGRQFSVFWPLLLLALFALVGSAFAKWMFQVNETYLAFGTYLLLLPLYASLVADSRQLRSWAGVLLALYVLASLTALVGEAARFGSRDTLHEIEYLVAVGFFALYYVSRSWFIKLAALAMMLAAVLLNQKLTGFLVTAMALLHVVVTAGWRGTARNWRGAYFMGALAFVVAVSAGLTLAYFEFRQYLPSGNAHVRLAQYEQAWIAFLASPIWGHAYLEGSGELFRQGNRAFNIPTHSDVLDVLKHGGLIALSLFLLGYWKIFHLIHRAVVATTGDRLLNAYFLTARFFAVTAFLTFSVNPLLLKGPFLMVIWGSLGLAAGLALHVVRRPQGPAV